MPSFQAAIREKIIGDEIFTGSGLDDMESGGTYNGAYSAVYEIIIDGTGAPDTFKWNKDGGSYTTGVSIAAPAGTPQEIENGLFITFAATTGHTLNDKWEISVTVEGIDAVQTDEGKTLNVTDHSNYLTNTDVGHAESDFDEYRKLFIAPWSGAPVDIDSLTTVVPHWDSDNSQANSDIIPYTPGGIIDDDVYVLTLITVPTWDDTVTYEKDMCVYYDTDVWKATAATTTPGSFLTSEWSKISSPIDLTTGEVSSSLSSAYYDQEVVALAYNLMYCRDVKVHGSYCTVSKLCKDVFCRDADAILTWKLELTMGAIRDAVELEQWDTVQEFLTLGNNLCNNESCCN